jgi:hypothetical protein
MNSAVLTSWMTFRHAGAGSRLQLAAETVDFSIYLFIITQP